MCECASAIEKVTGTGENNPRLSAPMGNNPVTTRAFTEKQYYPGYPARHSTNLILWSEDTSSSICNATHRAEASRAKTQVRCEPLLAFPDCYADIRS